MRGLFSVVGLVAVLLVVGLLARKQVSAVAAPGVAPAVPGATASPGASTPQQTVEQFRQATENLVQQPRVMPDDK